MMRFSALALCVLMIGACSQAPESSLSDGLWADYRHAYIRDDGRVVDNGQQGISHSEGQGYAMILAEAANDRATFQRVWSWTQDHLQVRADALLAWKWDPRTGSVVDTNNATDADLLVAWALLRAAHRWEAPDYRNDAITLAQDIRTYLVVPATIGPVLLPGVSGFVHDGAVTINPSYWIFPALTELGRIDPEGPWTEVRQTGLVLLDIARFGSQALPADWVVMSDPPLPSPLFPHRFGFEAIRIPLYASWDGLTRHPALQSLATFWARDANPPAWVDLDDGSHAPIGLRPGAMAVRRLLLTNGRAALDEHASVEAGGDYYDSTLLLLANVAADESS
jgi:endo-1,4-beta-D-glucanase Y